MTTSETSTTETTQPQGIKIAGLFSASTSTVKAIGRVVGESTGLVLALTELTRARIELTEAEGRVAEQAHQRTVAGNDSLLSGLAGLMANGARFGGEGSMFNMASGHRHGASGPGRFDGMP